METILLPRTKGKTTELIKMAIETGSVLVCYSKTLAISRMKQNEGLRAISFYDFINKSYRGRYVESFLIDDADMLLQSLSDVPISAISISKREEKQTGR